MSLIYFYSNPFVWFALLAYFYSHLSKACACGVFLCFCFGLKLLVVLACYCALPIFFSPFIVLAQRPSSSLLSNPNQEAGAAGMIRAVRHALPAHKIGLFPSFPCNQFELIHTNAGKVSNIISWPRSGAIVFHIQPHTPFIPHLADCSTPKPVTFPSAVNFSRAIAYLE